MLHCKENVIPRVCLSNHSDFFSTPLLLDEDNRGEESGHHGPQQSDRQSSSQVRKRQHQVAGVRTAGNEDKKQRGKLKLERLDLEDATNQLFRVGPIGTERRLCSKMAFGFFIEF